MVLLGRGIRRNRIQIQGEKVKEQKQIKINTLKQIAIETHETAIPDEETKTNNLTNTFCSDLISDLEIKVNHNSGELIKEFESLNRKSTALKMDLATRIVKEDKT